MSATIKKGTFLKNYALLIAMVVAIICGCIVGAIFPKVTENGEVIKQGATVLAPLGKVFINLMFCIVVPMVFASIAGAVANMGNRKRAGKIMVTTVVTFIVTGAIAALIMFLLMEIFPPVLTAWEVIEPEVIGDYATLPEMIVNFFTAEDFVGLLSRRAMLPLIVFSLLFGFAVNLNGGKESMVGKFLEDLSNVMMKVVKIVTYYAPIAFFGFFADLVATYGPQITADYGRALAVYYPLCFIYLFTAFPLFAWIGGGKKGPGMMFKHLLRPAMVSLGTCSSVATIPTNMDAAEETGISRDVSDIVLPLGATMHMDGSCFSCVLKIAFVMGVFGVDLTLSNLIPVILVAVLSSVGMSGVPHMIEEEGDVTYHRMYVIEKAFKNKNEALLDMENFNKTPDIEFKYVLNDIFGDG